MNTSELIKANLAGVEQRIVAACQRSKRDRNSVTLVAVTKLHPLPVVEAAWQVGLKHFGENYAQELRDKAAAFSPEGLHWHAIGALQQKNAKYVAKAAHFFHALESLEVAQELSKRRTGAALKCFIEVNVAKESSKAGMAPDALPQFLKTAALPGLEFVGLTAMPPLVDDAEQSRPHFAALRELAKAHQLPLLSMGTTSDFEVAIEEGATHIRVGTALFGERPPR